MELGNFEGRIANSQKKYFSELDKNKAKKWGFGKKMKMNQELPLLEVVKCDCGNEIKMYRKQEEVKCFKCNLWHHKVDGVWEKAVKTKVKPPKTETNKKVRNKSQGLTIGDFPIVTRKRKK